MEYLDNLNKGLSEKKKLTVEQLRAAYALNMCTVSVSQIVDYNDAYILEQEYDAILNNLNLEQIPKDEALLKILIELLNTITFFRVQEIKKKQIENKYQEQMKNAIWNAIPNLGVIVTSGNPVAICISLATQIGAGYMNYRKAKAQNSIAKADSEIELQIVAIEQFNALKRELFTTAWRLADHYGFDDRLRLTERQIEQYNSILLDPDELRKYARLEAIQDRFQAYPPFWYFYGHTAAYIAEEAEDEKTRAFYIEKAKSHFCHYELMNDFSILREDHLTASFALEFIDLLLLDNHRDSDRINKLLVSAIDNSGNEFDLLQLCAITSLRIGNREIAKKLFKQLVNEDYNKIVNAQLLSCIYVQEMNYPEYEVLGMRVPAQYLFPMPLREEKNIDELQAQFETRQRKLLKEKFKLTLKAVSSQYAQKMNRKLSVFDLNDDYEDDYFADDDRGKRLRHTKAARVLNDETRKNYYLDRLRTISLPVVYTDVADDMLQNILNVSIFKSEGLRKKAVEITANSLRTFKDQINDCQEKADTYSFSMREYDVLQSIGISVLMKDTLDMLYRSACNTIDNAIGTELMSLDGNLFKLCNMLSIPVPEIETGNQGLIKEHTDDIPHLSVNLFGSGAYVAQKETDHLKKMAEYTKKLLSQVRISDNVTLLYREVSDVAFDNYFNNGIFDEYPILYANSVAVVQHFNEKYDLIFTVDSIVYLYKGQVKKKVPYEEISLQKDKLNLWGIKIKSTDVDLNGLFGVIRSIRGKYINDSSQRHEYVGTKADVKMLNAWFKNASCDSIEGTEMVYAKPEQNLLDSLGIVLEESDWSNCLLQFIYDTQNKLVLEYRIVEFEELTPKFEEKLKQSGGLIRLGY